MIGSKVSPERLARRADAWQFLFHLNVRQECRIYKARTMRCVLVAQYQLIQIETISDHSSNMAWTEMKQIGIGTCDWTRFIVYKTGVQRVQPFFVNKVTCKRVAILKFSPDTSGPSESLRVVWYSDPQFEVAFCFMFRLFRKCCSLRKSGTNLFFSMPPSGSKLDSVWWSFCLGAIWPLYLGADRGGECTTGSRIRLTFFVAWSPSELIVPKSGVHNFSRLF